MKKFKDNEGREWIVSVNVATIKRVKDLLKLDLLEDEGGEAITSVSSDPILLVDVLWCILMKDAEDRGVSDEQFGAAMAGECIERATDAFVEDLIDFFPPFRRKYLRAAWNRSKQMTMMAVETATQKVEDGRLDEVMRRQMKKIEDEFDKNLESFGSESTNSPVSAE